MSELDTPRNFAQVRLPREQGQLAGSREIQILQEISRTILDSSDLKAMTEGILKKAAVMGGFDIGMICFVSAARQTLEPVAHYGFRDHANLKAYRQHMKEQSTAGIVDRVIATKEIRIVDLSKTGGIRTFRREDVRSLVVVPLRTDQDALGVMYLGNRQPIMFEPSQMRLLEAIGTQAGIAVQKIRLFEAVERRAKEQEALNVIAAATSQSLELKELLEIAADKTVMVTERQRINFRLKDPLTGDVNVVGYRGFSEEEIAALRRITPHPMSEQVFASGTPLVINNQREASVPGLLPRTQSVAWIPVKAGATVVGVLGVSDDQSKPFTPNEVELLQAIGSVIGVAVENARLFEQTKKQAAALEESNKAKDELLVVMAQQKEELSYLNAGLEREIAKRGRAKAEIAAKNRDLETLLYVTSHDLREPLRAIENFSRIVNDRYSERLDEKGRDFLRRIISGAQRLNRLLDDILTLSRSQRIGVPSEQVDGASIISEALKRLEGKISATGARIQVAKDFQGLRVDKTWATQAVYNLLANALKFTRAGEAPDIEVAPYRPPGPGRNAVGIAVRDRGPGVAPEHAERIFQLFQRAVGREVEGTGAGLAIVRQIAERHGGNAWVEPRQGGGSEFIITFGDGQDFEGGMDQ
ncbi:MAG TPA: GAF domain-containing protein [Candidatus Binatia bacterium]|jgi:signal transduction histidine kinase